MNKPTLSGHILQVFATEGFPAVQRWWRKNWWRNMNRKSNAAHFKTIAAFVLKKENIQQSIDCPIDQWQQMLRFSARHAGKETVTQCLLDATGSNKKWAIDALINDIPSKYMVEILNCAADCAHWEIVDHLHPLVGNNPNNDCLKMAMVHKNKQRVEDYLALATHQQKSKAFFYTVVRNDTSCGDLIFDQLSLSDRIHSVCLALHCGSDNVIQWLCERMPPDHLHAAWEYNKTDKALRFKKKWDYVFSSYPADEETIYYHNHAQNILESCLTKDSLTKAVEEGCHIPTPNKRKI